MSRVCSGNKFRDYIDIQKNCKDYYHRAEQIDNASAYLRVP